VVAVAALALAACSAPAPSAEPLPEPSPTPSARYPVGLQRYPTPSRRPLPALAGPTLEGAPTSLARERGHVVVLNVWASWCVPCREESRVLATLRTRRPAVRWIGMDENDAAGTARAFLRAAGYPPSYPTMVDDGSRLSALAAWLPQALPGTLVVDPQGRVAARVVGAVSAGQLEPVLAELGA
jgi:thiol-disulfide isomerase/thioredoxin